MSEPFVLYGAYASYFTAKTRSYLRKKGIPFIERLPSDPRFRNYVRPTSGSHRIPQLETPEGEVWQDSTTIFDGLEARFPDLPALPATPRQRLVAHLMELFGSEGLLPLAWRYRWFHEDNLHFVKMDFGRSFKPQGSDEELMKYGQLIADRMLSRGRTQHDAALLEEMERQFAALLEKLEQHFIDHPFMLGGHPSVADYVLMGPLFAHMGRDPVPLHFMQRHAPRVFRWVEHMNTPEVVSPEFPDTPISYFPNDEIPSTFAELLRHLFDEHAERFVTEALAYIAYVEDQRPEPGSPISDEEDQPRLPVMPVTVQGEAGKAAAVVQNVWLLQRALAYYQSLSATDQAASRELLESLGLGDLLALKIPQAPVRRDNRFYFGD